MDGAVPRASSRRASLASSSNWQTNDDRRNHDEHRHRAARLHPHLDARRRSRGGLPGVDRSGPPRLVLQRPSSRSRPSRSSSTCVSAASGASTWSSTRDTTYFTGGVYREIVPDEKLVFAWGATDGWPQLDLERLDDSPLVTVTLSQPRRTHRDERSRRAAGRASRTTACPSGGRWSAAAGATRSTASPPSSGGPRSTEVSLPYGSARSSRAPALSGVRVSGRTSRLRRRPSSDCGNGSSALLPERLAGDGGRGGLDSGDDLRHRRRNARKVRDVRAVRRGPRRERERAADVRRVVVLTVPP